ncbi:PEP_CTERM-anchored TLD domain-containing protein [Saccharophagus degradans]|uniref:PEP_CTERM-anchored TLD domain-containing protein n=1 Tax=Saccharophagus degradans TaxID=86304 RepID=UPI002477D50D|nr:PEP_CTERM-anchored TLD domain-containing protein [Saccharophagus degradans]WGO98649.1 PEP_CTERM-anchored TLD domain-containing protein [Saccharophagus degradans]
MRSTYSPLKKALALFAASFLACSAQAGLINGGTLLDQAGADQLENWLGLDDQDFTNIYTGTAGVSNAAGFHNAVDGAGATFSIYGITLADGSTARVGGYTTLSWAGSGYAYDSEAFLFNLDTGEAQFTQNYNNYSIYRNANYFATFGGGHDLFGGIGTLGSYNGAGLNSTNDWRSGYSYSHSYDQSQGRITVANDSGYGAGNSGSSYNDWAVNSLEVYTFAGAVSVPEPSTLALFGIGLLGLGISRRRTKA